MTNTRANWLRFGAFLAASSLPSASVGTDHRPLFPRPAPHATRASLRRDQRGRVVRGPSPASYCLAPTVELPKTQRDPISTRGDLDERLLYYSMSQNQAIPADKSIRSSPLAADHPLIVLS